MHSLFSRISALRKQSYYVEVGRAAHLFPNGHLLLCTRTQARSIGTQEMRASHPGASLGDLKILLSGWDMAGRWLCQVGNEDFCNPLRESNKACVVS
jgi:hypothetical protein